MLRIHGIMNTKDAISHFGSSVKALAHALGITREAVYQWGETVPPLRAYQIRELISVDVAGKALEQPEPDEKRQDEAHPVRALACAAQSVRLTADRREADRREVGRRAESVAIAAPDQLPLALDAGQSCMDAEQCSTQLVSSRPDHRA